MERQSFAAGKVIFREGEDSQEAYRVISGKVQISVPTPNGPQILSHVNPGEIFGEMGMVDEQPRSAAAIAASDVLVEVISMETFIDYLQSDPNIMSAYLATVFERLRSSDLLLQMAIKRQSDAEYVGKDDISLEELLYRPAVPEKEEVDPSPKTLKLTATYEGQGINIEPIEMTIEKFPFRIGRLDALGETSPFGNNDLSIPDSRPFQVSRNHCAIEEQNGSYVIRDRGSTLGTLVNGSRIGVNHEVLSARLVLGENEIAFGSSRGPHQFRLVIS
tara:strand:+ start:609 stop:1433 length:825 start_codon:yes stop_codon:yes gene_type:complete